MRNIWIAALTVSLASPAWAGTIYKCKDQDGALHYQGTPCPSNDQAITSWAAQGGSDAADADGAGGKPLVLGQGRGGHYWVDGAVNGQYVNFLVDTGATLVTIPLSVATAAGLKCERASAMQTANGVTRSCNVTVANLTFGGFKLSYVDAVVVPNLEQPLLGMNVLKRFHVEQDGGQLHISRNY